eukprot:TRINITY_DN13989_c0_g1_i1.p1 TRINITY_DN13989_c0_g1~~TRINITY_DN13989_c0_g1_i1.p1  ORF type:complete len:246 (+),score=63.81 TRINITY_DN13989_c0_g1_i1:48-785(+)
MGRVLPVAASIAAAAAAAELYCPGPGDFSVGGGVQWQAGGGWRTKGGGGVHGNQTFNLLNGYVEFDIDTTQALTGVNNNFYLVFPDRTYFAPTNDCDIQGQHKPFCVEMDIIENNGNCVGATTWHTWPNFNGGCDRAGCSGKAYRAGTTRIRASFNATAGMAVTYDGREVPITHRAPSRGAVEALRDAMATHGAQIQSSQWVGWVPPGDCGPAGALADSAFSVTNLKVYGSVVQGAPPPLCPAAP